MHDNSYTLFGLRTEFRVALAYNIYGPVEFCVISCEQKRWLKFHYIYTYPVPLSHFIVINIIKNSKEL